MDGIDTLAIGRDAVMVMLKSSLPIMLVALGVGLTISLFQALTQIQEMTLSFVPKIIAVFFSLLIFLPYIYDNLSTYTMSLFQQIATPM